MNNSPLFAQLKDAYKISEKEFMEIIQLFEQLEVKKNEHIFRAGEITRHIYFVQEGCLRQYYVNNNGEERIIYFKVEYGWCSDLVSFLDNKPTELYAQALENSKLLIINQKNWLYAVTKIQSFAMGFIRSLQESNFILKKRLAEATVETPEEKYMHFIKEESHLLQRVPLYHIASYLSMTPETLSRIRKKISEK